LANKAISFDTPQSATAYYVQATGTVSGDSTAHVMVILNVTNTSTTHPRNDTFYLEENFTNSTFTPAAAHGTFGIAIVPKLIVGSDTVQASAVWSY
jgi:hypothetical protein